jgi:hypothetical protein
VREKDGQVVNSVVHTLTRDSENERQRIIRLVFWISALRFNPDLIFVGEMRGAEANAAQEAARTGVAVADHHPLQLLRGHLPPNGIPVQTRGGYVRRKRSWTM